MDYSLDESGMGDRLFSPDGTKNALNIAGDARYREDIVGKGEARFP